MSFYSIARVIVTPLIRLIYGIKIEGKENLLQKGSLIVCSNHRSNSDPVILGSTLPYELKFMAKAELFKIPFLRGLIRLLGAFPVNRGKNDTEAINFAVRLLKNNKVLAMFPEGTRQKNGNTPLRFKSGVSLFAYKTHATVLPVAIATEGKVRPFKRNIVRIGKPISYEDLGFTDGNAENLRNASTLLHDRIASLINDNTNADGEKSL